MIQLTAKMKLHPFDRKEHVYQNDAFVELVKDAVRFFNGTPIQMLPTPVSFLGTGVYAIYYTGNYSLYKRYAELNRLSYDYPIYVGSDWDVIHPGRVWAEKCNGIPKSASAIIASIESHLKSLGR